MLFKLSLFYRQGVIAIKVPQRTSAHYYASDTWLVVEQPLREADGSTSDVLRRFGSQQGPIPYLKLSRSQLDEVNTLVSSILNFYILSRLGGISIQWTESACMHLDLNKRDKTLMIFQYPSFCAMLCSGQEQGIFLDRHVKPADLLISRRC
jgi:hypothetical protein